MNVATRFHPIRQAGLSFHAVSILLLGGGGAICFILAFQARVGVNFLIYLAAALILLAPLPLLAYRGYALVSAHYDMDRDGLRLHWGLRVEDIALPDIEWVRPASDLTAPLPLPRFRWPGVLIGVLEVEGLGPIEFLASTSRELVLVATPLRIFAISPENPDAFIKSFRNINEMGSLTPIAPRSVYPTFLLARLWADRPARYLVLAGFTLGLALLIWVSLAIPVRSQVSLGYLPSGEPLDPGPAASLLLLPVLNGLTYLTDLLGGLFFYRRPDQKALAYVLWAGGVITPILMLVAVGFITL